MHLCPTGGSDGPVSPFHDIPLFANAEVGACLSLFYVTMNTLPSASACPVQWLSLTHCIFLVFQLCFFINLFSIVSRKLFSIWWWKFQDGQMQKWRYRSTVFARIVQLSLCIPSKLPCLPKHVWISQYLSFVKFHSTGMCLTPCRD